MLVADEITTMVDQRGRDALLGIAVRSDRASPDVPGPHHPYNSKAEMADRTVNLSDSVDNMVMVDHARHRRRPSPVLPRARNAPVLPTVQDQPPTPTARPGPNPRFSTSASPSTRATAWIHGGNGSADRHSRPGSWRAHHPDFGQCLVKGRPADQCVDDVAIAFQAARLQLLRSRVDLEVASRRRVFAYDTPRVVSALATVRAGQLPGAASHRPAVGGQMRRVVIAGLLARWPKALILDEPLAGLDAASQRGLLRLLTDLRRNTRPDRHRDLHDFAGLEGYCPRTLHLDNGMLTPAPTAAEVCRDHPSAGRGGAGRGPRRRFIHELWAGAKLVVFAISLLVVGLAGLRSR